MICQIWLLNISNTCNRGEIFYSLTIHFVHMGFSGGVGKSQHALGTGYSTCHIVQRLLSSWKRRYILSNLSCLQQCSRFKGIALRSTLSLTGEKHCLLYIIGNTSQQRDWKKDGFTCHFSQCGPLISTSGNKIWNSTETTQISALMELLVTVSGRRKIWHLASQ